MAVCLPVCVYVCVCACTRMGMRVCVILTYHDTLHLIIEKIFI